MAPPVGLALWRKGCSVSPIGMGAATNAFWEPNSSHRAIAEAQGVKDLAMAHIVHHVHGESDEVAVVFTA